MIGSEGAVSMSIFNKEHFASLLRIAQGTRSLNHFARHAGVSNSYISRLLRGLVPNPPEARTIMKLAEAAQDSVSYEDFMRAAGLLPSTLGIASNLSIVREIHEAPLSYDNRSAQTNPFISSEQQIAQAIYKVPVLANIQSNQPLLSESHIVGYEYIQLQPIAPVNLFIYYATENTMTGARIHAGDQIVLQAISSAQDGDLILANAGDQVAKLYRMKRLNDLTVLLTEHPQAEPLLIEHPTLRICGKIIQVTFVPSN